MRRLRWTLLFALSASLLSGCHWGKAPEARDPVEKIDATTLKVTHDAMENLKLSAAAIMDFPEQLSVMGKIGITEDRTDIVPARVAGRIDQIFFASGEHVTKGRPLCTLFSPDYVAAREEYLQALKKSTTATNGGDPSDFANLAQLAKRKLLNMGLSPEDVAELPNQGPETPGKPATLLVRAPRNGVIITKSAVLGNLVNVGDTLFMIGDLSKVWFQGDLYPEDLPKVKKNQEVRIVAPGTDKVLKGTVSFVSPLVDPNTRTIKIRALIDNPDGALRGDMYVQGSVVLKAGETLLVPSSSIVHSPEGDSVFKRMTPKTVENGADMVFKRIPVRPGAERQGMIAILDGIKEGDEVVSDGSLLLEAALEATGK